MAQEVTVKLTYDDAVLDPPPTFSGVGIAIGASYRLRCASRAVADDVRAWLTRK